MSNLFPGSCFGNFLRAAKECSGCGTKDRCSKFTLALEEGRVKFTGESLGEEETCSNEKIALKRTTRSFDKMIKYDTTMAENGLLKIEGSTLDEYKYLYCGVEISLKNEDETIFLIVNGSTKINLKDSIGSYKTVRSILKMAKMFEKGVSEEEKKVSPVEIEENPKTFIVKFIDFEFEDV